MITQLNQSPFNLNFFKYHAIKKYCFYPLIFYTIGLIFGMFALHLYMKEANHLCQLYFTHCALIKKLMTSICCLTGVGSILIGLLLTPHRRNFKAKQIKQGRRILSAIYRHNIGMEYKSRYNSTY